MTTDLSYWRRCSACKKHIRFGATYQVCSVSTCNRKRTGLVFCSMACWDSHLPGANHREAWALEKTAPASAQAQEAAPTRRRAARTAPTTKTTDDEILIIGSRLKDYIRRTSGMNTSDRALGPLSDIVRAVADDAIASAQREGRKTVLDRDVPTV